MTNEEFLTEALESPNCPKNFMNDYLAFCKYQGIVLDTLRELVRICDAHNIHYQLAFGSMLGAVRDGGQIPWDYDADVVIPFYERELLISSLSQELDGRYAFYAKEINPNYYPSFIRVVPKGYQHEMLHVDVFYLLGIPDDEPARSIYIKEVRDRYNARKNVLREMKTVPCSAKAKLKQYLIKLATIIQYGNQAKADINGIFGRYDLRETKDAIVVSVTIGKYIYPSQIFLNSVKINTREGTFRISAEYEDFFKIRYGNWRKYFPVENRIAEVEMHCRHFKWYQLHHLVPADAPEI